MNNYEGNIYDDHPMVGPCLINGPCPGNVGGCVVNPSACALDASICGLNVGGCKYNASACGVNIGACNANIGGCSKNFGACLTEAGACGTNLGACGADATGCGTKVMGTKYIHSLIVVTDKPIEDPTFQVDAVFESGPEHGLIKSSSSSLGFGNNVQHTDYESKRKKAGKDVATHLDKYKPQQVDVPEGKTVAEFDEDVMKAAKDYEAKKPEKYKIHKNSCNTATSSIIKDSGGNVKPKKSVPG